jgi:predicted ATP-grasp superfamily ATP-dependent carboligase
MRKRILILDAELPSALPFVQYYHQKGYKIYIGSSQIFPISSFYLFRFPSFIYTSTGYLPDYGKFRLVDPCQLSLFIKRLGEFIKKREIEYVISISETSLIPISLYIEYLDITRTYPPFKVIDLLHDKYLLFKKIKKTLPRSFYLPRVYEPPSLMFPCIVKPRKGLGSHFTYRCNNEREAREAIRKLKSLGREPIIQEYIPSKKKIVFNLLIDKKGKIVRLLSFQPIRRGLLNKIIKDLEKFFKSIGFFGLASPQFLIYNNHLYLIEINPRPSINFYGIDFFVNFPEAFHQVLIENKEVEERIKILEHPPSLLKSSQIYLSLSKKRGFFVVLKQIEEITKGRIISYLIHSSKI